MEHRLGVRRGKPIHLRGVVEVGILKLLIKYTLYPQKMLKRKGGHCRSYAGNDWLQILNLEFLIFKQIQQQDELQTKTSYISLKILS